MGTGHAGQSNSLRAVWGRKVNRNQAIKCNTRIVNSLNSIHFPNLENQVFETLFWILTKEQSTIIFELITYVFVFREEYST